VKAGKVTYRRTKLRASEKKRASQEHAKKRLKGSCGCSEIHDHQREVNALKD
jgi:hypothetical protein